MTNQSAAGNHIVLGERAPWFSAQLIPGGSFDLQASAGRWVVLSFFGSPANPRANAEFAKLLSQADLFKEDHLIVGCVFTEPPEDIAKLAEISSSALFFLADYDGAISRSYGALEMPRTIVLDPMLRAVADIAWDFPQGHAEAVGGVLRNLPAVDDSAGVPMSAPALILPRVFSFELCDFLIQFYEQQGGEDSGFQFDIAGKTTTLSDWRLKRRSDVILAVPEIRDLIRNQIVRRLLPEIERYFQFQVTRMDRYIVACYDSEVGGHFHRHRQPQCRGATSALRRLDQS